MRGDGKAIGVRVMTKRRFLAHSPPPTFVLFVPMRVSAFYLLRI